MPARAKDAVLQALSCDAWHRAMPPEGEQAVAYGYRSGKRIQMLTSSGMVRE